MPNKVALIVCWVILVVAAAVGIGLGVDWGSEAIVPAASASSKAVDTANGTTLTVEPPSIAVGGRPTFLPTNEPFSQPTSVPTDEPSASPSDMPSSLAPTTLPGATPLIVGNSTQVSISLRSFTDEGGSTVRSKFTYSIEEPGASYVSIHFASFDFSKECSMEISDADGVLVAEYTLQGRRNLGSFWARHVEGDTLSLLVFCLLGAGENKVDFEIDEVVTGLPDELIVEDILDDSANRPSIGDGALNTTRYLRAQDLFPIQNHREMARCGRDDSTNAKCYMDSHPTEYDLGKAISRLKIAGRGTCTGWLVGPNNLLMTNHHCIRGVDDMEKTDFQFMAEGASCNVGKGSTAGYDVYDGIEIVNFSYQKDYALIRLDGDPASKYGYLDIDDRVATVGETIFIPGHPAGRAKQFSIMDTQSNSGASDGRCAILDVGGDSCGYSTRYNSIQYTCDTLGGSSGSPVISVDTGKVLGLHHCGAIANTNCRDGNLAVPMEGPGIFQEIKEFLEAPIPKTPFPSTSPPTTSPPTLQPSFLPTTSGTAPPTVEVTSRCFAPKMKIEIQLDNYAAETRWELWQTDPPRMITGGGGYENNALVEEEHCLADDGLHYLRFFDDFGDGFCCGKGNGYYKIWYQGFQIYHNNGAIGNFTELEISPDQVCLDVLMHLTLQTDRYPVETTWELLDDSSGLVLASGGPYFERYQWVEESICGTSFGSYTFTIRDSFKDGLSAGGSFTLTRDNEVKIESDGVFERFVSYSIPSLGPAEIINQG
ncbi:unnamed protein product [Cylindrotheca closterium]|uniref:Serine protease n=1 Tax=Cylindrotheca closterium TaxID=2856 RepID=A0AAD2G717_9STRA|nr:unnamed protein product [Cylindrotheca closterium]